MPFSIRVFGLWCMGLRLPQELVYAMGLLWPSITIFQFFCRYLFVLKVPAKDFSVPRSLIISSSIRLLVVLAHHIAMFTHPALQLCLVLYILSGAQAHYMSLDATISLSVPTTTHAMAAQKASVETLINVRTASSLIDNIPLTFITSTCLVIKRILTHRQ